MKMFFSSPGSVVAALLFSATGLVASPASDEVPVTGGQIASGLALPFWEEGECRENFEVRIWPQSVLIWLEEEHLRGVIADPATPDEERQSLRRLLALQRAWRVHS